MFGLNGQTVHTCRAWNQSGEEVVSGWADGADTARDRVEGGGIRDVQGVQQLFGCVVLRQIARGRQVVDHGRL